MFARVKGSLNQIAILALKTVTTRLIFLVMKSLSLGCSLALAMCSFISLNGGRHSSSDHLYVIVGPKNGHARCSLPQTLVQR